MSTAPKLLAALAFTAAAVAASVVVATFEARRGPIEAAAPRPGPPPPTPPNDEDVALLDEPAAQPPPRVEATAALELSDPELPVRARVVLRVELAGARGLGGELELRLFPYTERQHLQRLRIGEDPRLLDTLAAWRTQNSNATGWERPDFAALLEESDHEVDELGISLEAARDGRIERDVTDLVTSSLDLPAGLLLTVRHENFRPLELWIPLRAGGARIDRERLAEEGEIELHASATLAPVCVVRGQAWCFDGSDCEVRVEAWSLAGDEPSAMVGEALVSEPDHLYALALEPGARYAIVAIAEGYLPQTVILYTWDQLDLWLAPMVIDHGVSFNGTLDLARHSFGSSVWLYLSRENPVLAKGRHGRNGLLWNGAGFEPEMQASRRSQDGSFSFTGLVPGAYELRFGIDREWWTQMDPVIYVRAPADGIRIQPPLARISFEIEQDRLPVAHRPIRLVGVGRSAGSAELVTDAWGRAEAWLFPGEPYVVHVTRPEGADWSYGKVVPWKRLEVVERISMGSSRGAR